MRCERSVWHATSPSATSGGSAAAGLNSREIMTEHFSKYGRVDRVLVAQTKVKLHRGALMRHRPGSLGLVLMETPEVVKTILSYGEAQEVGGHMISLQAF